MPAFTFEKISPPVRHGPPPGVEKKQQRGVIFKILGRLVDTKDKHEAPHQDDEVIARNQHQLPK
jgi:hypothetical protein